MNETSWLKLGAAALVIWGLKLILFGGTKTTGTYFEIFDFEFGATEEVPMSTFECWFVGLALIAAGLYIFKHMILT